MEPALGLAGTALASSFAADRRGDVRSCTGECSTYSVDLKSISLSRSNGYLVIRVDQYGAFQKANPLYWPQIELYTTSATPTRGPAPPWAAHHADFSVYVNNPNGGTCHAPKGYEMDLWKGGRVVWVLSSSSCRWPSRSSIASYVPLKKIGNPRKVRARAWQAAVGSNGKPYARDVAPDIPGVVSK